MLKKESAILLENMIEINKNEESTALEQYSFKSIGSYNESKKNVLANLKNNINIIH